MEKNILYKVTGIQTNNQGVTLSNLPRIELLMPFHSIAAIKGNEVILTPQAYEGLRQNNIYIKSLTIISIPEHFSIL